MTEYYHTLLEKGGRILRDGEVVQETDYQILGHKKNEAQTPPEKKWIGWKKAQGFPHPTFIRMPEDPAQQPEDPTIKESLQVDRPRDDRPREHISSPNCWCEPELDYKDPGTGAEVWVHRSMQ